MKFRYLTRKQFSFIFYFEQLLVIIGSWSFSVSGPTVWNALTDYLRNPTLSIDVFKFYLKTFLFAQH